MGTTRLAPSPTGALHLGNVRTFVVNWALARQRNWRIVLRIEDLDTPRVKPETVQLTLDLLAWLGLCWDGDALVQSTRRDAHVAAMQALAAGGWVYASAKVRSMGEVVEAAQSAPNEGAREVRFGAEHRPASLPTEFADLSPTWRFATPAEEVVVHDGFVGRCVVKPAESVGDFVVWSRRDCAHGQGQAAYQLAVVVDDAFAGVTHVVRGNDLLDSAGRQMLLMRALGIAPPAYIHLPLVRGSDGKRLAKRHGDTRLDVYRARGVSARRVIGLMASWCGIEPREQRREMDLGEFVERFSLATLSTQDVVYGAEDEAWLMAGQGTRARTTR
jgi:glutamyl-tRNA synthetase